MGETDFLLQLKLVVVSVPDATGRPFAYTIHGQDRSLIERRWIECACSMGLMVVQENNPFLEAR